MNNSKMADNFTDSILYEQFKDAGHCWTFIGTAFILNAISIPGIFMNFSIIYVTIKYTTIRGTSSFLLALTAFFDILHALGHLLFLFVSISGQNFIKYGLASKMLALPLLGCSASVFSMALTGFDRLLQVANSKWHNELNRLFYLGTLVSLSIFIGGIPPVLKYIQTAHLLPNLPTTGYISDIFVADFRDQFYLFMLCCNLMAILFYLAVWLVVRKKTAEIQQFAASNKECKTNSRVFKSLVAIIFINIGGYFICVFVRLFIEPLFHFNPIQLWIFESYLGILLNLGIALNAPVLFCCCTEYRRCFSRELGIVTHKMFGARYPSQVATISIVPISKQRNEFTSMRTLRTGTNSTMITGKSKIDLTISE